MTVLIAGDEWGGAAFAQSGPDQAVSADGSGGTLTYVGPWTLAANALGAVNRVSLEFNYNPTMPHVPGAFPDFGEVFWDQAFEIAITDVASVVYASRYRRWRDAGSSTLRAEPLDPGPVTFTIWGQAETRQHNATYDPAFSSTYDPSTLTGSLVWDAATGLATVDFAGVQTTFAASPPAYAANQAFAAALTATSTSGTALFLVQAAPRLRGPVVSAEPLTVRAVTVELCGRNAGEGGCR